MYNSKQIDFSHYLLFSIQQLPITNNRLVNSADQLNKNIQKLNMFEYGISEIEFVDVYYSKSCMQNDAERGLMQVIRFFFIFCITNVIYAQCHYH